MPCDSSHMESSDRERKASVLFALLDEVKGMGRPDPKTFGNGYDKRAYNRSICDSTMHAMACEICAAMQSADPRDYSLEMQMWWRDHQAADRERVERELSEAKAGVERARAMEKLTPYERRLLGLEQQ